MTDLCNLSHIWCIYRVIMKPLVFSKSHSESVNDHSLICCLPQRSGWKDPQIWHFYFLSRFQHSAFIYRQSTGTLIFGLSPFLIPFWVNSLIMFFLHNFFLYPLKILFTTNLLFLMFKFHSLIHFQNRVTCFLSPLQLIRRRVARKKNRTCRLNFSDYVFS